MEQFMFAVDSDLKPVVGQQVTLTTLSEIAAASPRIDLLVSQAGLGNCDLVVKGRVACELRLGPPAGWPVPQRPAVRGLLAEADLRSLAATAGEERNRTRVAGLRDPNRRRPGRGRPVRPGRQLSLPRER